MVKDTWVTIRVDSRLKIILIKFAKMYKKNLSDFMISACVEKIENTKKLSNPQKNKMLEELKQLQTQEEMHKKFKRNAFDLFLPKNTAKMILDMGFHSLVLNQELNMPQIRKILEDSFDVFNSMPKDMQNILKEDMDELKKFGNEEYILNILNQYTILRKATKQLGLK